MRKTSVAAFAAFVLGSLLGFALPRALEEPVAPVVLPTPTPVVVEDPALRARIAELEAELAAAREAPPPAVVALGPSAPAEALAAPAAGQAEAEPVTEPAPEPQTLAGWIGLAREANQVPEGLLAWVGEDPQRLRELAGRLSELPPGEARDALFAALRKHAARDREVQAAMLALAEDPLAEVGARRQALEYLGQALARDPLFSERLSAAERTMLSQLARSGPGELRAAAVNTLLHLPGDPLALALFQEAWRDTSLPIGARQEALRGLKHASTDAAYPQLIEAIAGDHPVELRREAAVSLVYLNPGERSEESFALLAPGLAEEPDWLAKGFTIVALMQLDHHRAAGVLQALQANEVDPWEAEKYQALAQIAAQESDYQRILHQGIQAYRRIEARKAEALQQ